MSNRLFQTKSLHNDFDTIAPDGSEIRVLALLDSASSAHVRLHIGQVSQAIKHDRVEEIWYILSGEAELWRKQGGQETITPLKAHMSISIPINTHFQFRNTGTEPFDAFIVTVPAWKDASDAVSVTGVWQPSV